MSGDLAPYIHPTAAVADSAKVGTGTRIWHHCHVREDATIGRDCTLGKDVYVDVGVRIGDRVKIQNGAMLYRGATIESGAFIGPGVILANDLRPRAINPDGTLKDEADWQVGETHVGYGASVGAGAIVLPGVRIGEFALVGAGAVVTRDAGQHALVFGNPARQRAFVCKCATRLLESEAGSQLCPSCGSRYQLGGPGS